MMEYTQHQQELLDKVRDLMAGKGADNKKHSQAEASAKIGISKTALSQLLNGTYQANPQKMFETLESYFHVKERAQLTYREVRYADTCISSEIYDVIGVCHAKGGLAIAAGDAGIGKTKAAQHYVEEHPTNAILITVNPCLTSIKAVLNELAERLGAPAEHSRDRLWRAIAQKLSDGMVLIFDESQHLTLKTIEVLRSFSDYFNDRGQTLGICFVGNMDTVAHVGSKKAEFAQIANRTKQTKIYTRMRIRRSDIVKLFPILEKEGMEQEIDYLLGVAQTPQALRGAINLFSNAYDNENYTYAGLVAMAKFMDMEI